MANWPYNTKAWQGLRAKKLGANPLCEYCLPERLTPATQVDHREPIARGGSPWAWDNLASSCAPCHSRKTVYEDGGFGRKPGKVKVKYGCDANGRPLDPEHHWNKPANKFANNGVQNKPKEAR